MPEQTSWLGGITTAQTFLSTLLTAKQPDHTEPSSDDPLALTEHTRTAPITNGNDTTLQRTQDGSTSNEPNTPQDASSNTSSSLQSDENTPPWKQRILDKNSSNKAEINKIGDDFTEKAIVRIEGMSEEKREKAADEYIKSTNYIMKGVKNVMDLSVSIGRYF